MLNLELILIKKNLINKIKKLYIIYLEKLNVIIN